MQHKIIFNSKYLNFIEIYVGCRENAQKVNWKTFVFLICFHVKRERVLKKLEWIILDFMMLKETIVINLT